MPQFAYQGRNARGETVKGVLEGGSAGAIADQLFNTGITPINISQTSSDHSGTEDNWFSRMQERPLTLVDLMFLCRQLTKSSYPEIGERFNKDHSTVISAVRKIERLG